MQRKQTSTHIFSSAILLILSMGLWLVACTPDEEVVVVTVRSTVGGTAVIVITPDPTSTPFPVYTPAPTITTIPPSPTANPTAVAICNLNPRSALPANQTIKNDLIFVSRRSEPLAVSEPWTPTRNEKPQLWVVSIDGQQAGRITMKGDSVASYFPKTSSPVVWLMSNTEFIVDEAIIWQIPLPLECDAMQGDPENQFPACGNFEISPDGEWATFIMGDYWTGYNTEDGLINLGTGEVNFSTTGTSVMRFLPNGERLVYNSWGEGAKYGG